jgi:hypothetical protein
MKKAWAWTAIVILAVGGSMCRADDEAKDTPEKPASTIAIEDKDAKEVPAVNTEVVPVQAKDEVKKDEGRDYVVPLDAKNGGAPAGKDYVVTIDAQQCSKGRPPMQPSPGLVWSAPCNRYCGRGKECFQLCTQRIWNWLTYRPLSRPGLAGCCQKCCDCHVPPLYTYFLDRCHAAGYSYGVGAAQGCQGCAHP